MIKKFSILIADDQKDNIIVILDMLKTSTDVEYTVMAAPNGKIACELAEKKLPDMIIMDWEMPVMNGIEAVRQIKANPITSDIPIIMATALASSSHLGEALEVGAIDYVRKPIDRLELLARVKSSLLLSESYKKIKTQKELLSHNNKLITDSIKYAHRIQSAILPSEEYIKDLFNDAFVFIQPKDCVSGDFYWGKKINNKIFIAAVDCTGHGVPGAFMSLIGYNLLEQLSNETINPAQLLDLMKTSVCEKLVNEKNQFKVNDGMDMSLCVIDYTEMIINYAGAYNPLFLISNNTFTETKANKMPVGKALLETGKKFTNHQMSFSKGDKIYLFSDGYADQIGGSENDKFFLSNFRDMIIENSKLPMNDQKEVIKTRLFDWIGDNAQIDDIMVLGIEL